MSRYTVLVRPVVARELGRLPRAAAAAVRDRIRALADDPRPPGARPIEGRPDLLRIRVGDYRILYGVQDQLLVVLIVRVGHRKRVYDRLPDGDIGDALPLDHPDPE